MKGRKGGLSKFELLSSRVSGLKYLHFLFGTELRKLSTDERPLNYFRIGGATVRSRRGPDGASVSASWSMGREHRVDCAAARAILVLKRACVG